MLGSKLLLFSLAAYVSGQGVTYSGVSNVRQQSQPPPRLPPRFPNQSTPSQQPANDPELSSPAYDPQPVYQPVNIPEYAKNTSSQEKISPQPVYSPTQPTPRAINNNQRRQSWSRSSKPSLSIIPQTETLAPEIVNSETPRPIQISSLPPPRLRYVAEAISKKLPESAVITLAEPSDVRISAPVAPPAPVYSFPQSQQKPPSPPGTIPEISFEARPLSDFQCSRDSGYYSIINQCDSYIECKNQRSWQHTCPDGLHFNSGAIYPEYPCAYPSEVKCESAAVKQIARPTDQCPRQYGFFSIPGGDCSKYLMCQEGMSTLMSCPLGLVFNDQLSSCDWPENVPQCNADAFKDISCPIPPADDEDFLSKYRYGEDCKLYVACQRGHPRLLRCDPGLSFDEDSQVCVDSDYVRDCGARI